MPNTKTQKEIEKVVAELREKIAKAEFSYWKVGTVIIEWGKVEDFLTQKLEHLAKQKDEEFMEMIGEDEKVL